MSPTIRTFARPHCVEWEYPGQTISDDCGSIYLDASDNEEYINPAQNCVELLDVSVPTISVLPFDDGGDE
jgi:hypothetical protein